MSRADSLFEQLFNRFFPSVTFVTYEQLKDENSNETYYREIEQEKPEADDYENL
jgi:hypothetical protein